MEAPRGGETSEPVSAARTAAKNLRLLVPSSSGRASRAASTDPASKSARPSRAALAAARASAAPSLASALVQAFSSICGVSPE